jgi:hypothetical protein
LKGRQAQTTAAELPFLHLKRPRKKLPRGVLQFFAEFALEQILSNS